MSIVPLIQIGDVVSYTICGMAKNYSGKGKVIDGPYHRWGSIYTVVVWCRGERAFVRNIEIKKAWRQGEVIYTRED